jgi:hypothetical protein
MTDLELLYVLDIASKYHFFSEDVKRVAETLEKRLNVNDVELINLTQDVVEYATEHGIELKDATEIIIEER